LNTAVHLTFTERNLARRGPLSAKVSKQEARMRLYVRLSLAILLISVAPLPLARAADTNGCTPQERSNQTLSQKLDQTKGVICPPDVDPAMQAPTPNAGKTRIIPPPGTPGGDPNVQPK
jgi:hypothetical protein